MLSLEVVFVLGGLFGFLAHAMFRTRLGGGRLASLLAVYGTRRGHQ
jgi:uncharacterized membrane protein YeaQ/YmgE (transglycosylase-associated protein family)